jgi:hypothetical protein
MAGHVFISYVREDSGRVDELQRMLEAAGIPVWRDTADLWPGEDWRQKIGHAITDNALVFIACFSRHGAARTRSYQNEELLLAVDQLRLRRPDDPWLIPVRFDDCDIPDLAIGGGRTLGSLQRADLFSGEASEGAARLIRAVLRILERSSPAPVQPHGHPSLPAEVAGMPPPPPPGPDRTASGTRRSSPARRENPPQRVLKARRGAAMDPALPGQGTLAVGRRADVGGSDGESVDEAKLRAARALRSSDRAVTARDFEVIAAQAAGPAARVHCVPPDSPADPVRVLVLPDVTGYGPGPLPFAALAPEPDLLQRIAAALDRRRLVGTRVVVEPPRYRGVTMALQLRARRGRDPDQLTADALAALYRWLHPRLGGPEQSGWPFGRPVTLGAALAGLPDLDYVEDARLYPADPVSGSRGPLTGHVEVAGDALPFSFEHLVQVLA